MYAFSSISLSDAFTLTEKQLRFVYVGRLSEEKGIDVLIKAFGINKFELTIIGDGPLKKEVVAFANANTEIQYLGFQKKDVVQQVLQASSAFLFCSKCLEGMPMAILESFSNGTPVIASALGNVPDIVTDGFDGLLFNNGDEYDLCNKIQQWTNMPLHCKKKYHNNAVQTYKNRFSAEINIERLLTIYNSLL